jgi:hypothetical protein
MVKKAVSREVAGHRQNTDKAFARSSFEQAKELHGSRFIA